MTREGFKELIIPFYDYVIYMSNKLVCLDNLIHSEVEPNISDICECINQSAVGAEFYIIKFLRQRDKKRPKYPYIENFIEKLKSIKGYLEIHQPFYNKFEDFTLKIYRFKDILSLKKLLNWPIHIIVPYYTEDLNVYLLSDRHMPVDIIGYR